MFSSYHIHRKLTLTFRLRSLRFNLVHDFLLMHLWYQSENPRWIPSWVIAFARCLENLTDIQTHLRFLVDATTVYVMTIQWNRKLKMPTVKFRLFIPIKNKEIWLVYEGWAIGYRLLAISASHQWESPGVLCSWQISEHSCQTICDEGCKWQPPHCFMYLN